MNDRSIDVVHVQATNSQDVIQQAQREAAVNEIKQQIQDGTYSISYQTIAINLLTRGYLE